MAEFTNEKKYGQSVSITYNESGITYDNLNYAYEGQLATIWTNESKHN